MVFLSSFESCLGKRLARKPAGEQVNASNPGKVGARDVAEVWHSRELECEMAAAERRDFAEADGAESGPLGGEGEASNAGKQVKMGWCMVHFRTNARTRKNRKQMENNRMTIIMALLVRLRLRGGRYSPESAVR